MSESRPDLSTAPMLVAIAATFTVEPVVESIAYWLKRLRISAEIKLAPYNQVVQQLLDGTSLVSTNEHGINVHFIRFEDWEGSARTHEATHTDGDLSRSSEMIEKNLSDFVQSLKTAVARCAVPQLVFLCPASPSVREVSPWVDLFKQMQERLADKLAAIPGIHLVTPELLAALYPVDDYYDPDGDRLGHLPYTPVFFTVLGTMVARRIHALKMVPRKVIALDCDQTLWRGVCGEDGPEGVQIDASRRALQQFMMNQYDAGMLLCLCSKNNEQDVWDVFQRRPEMLLKREHFVASQLNWGAKSENLRALAVELNLGLDSFIFIDDNPVECAEVNANCPEVLTIQLPEQADEVGHSLSHVWVFDHLQSTEEDKQRTALYRQNIGREQFRQETLSFEQFLSGLDLQIDISALAPEQMGRAAQLSQRTNQFNFTAVRRTEGEIQRLLSNSHVEAMSVKLQDRFGDYGMVGLVVFRTTPGSIEIDTFLLSCRALGKGVEHRMLAHLGETACARGLEYIDLNFIRTAKNQPAIDFLNQVAGECGEIDDERHSFRFPARNISGLTFNPKTVGTLSTRVPAKPLAMASGNSASATATLSWIASEMRDAAHIHRVIEGTKRVDRPQMISQKVAPRDALEQQLTQLWEKLFRIESIGIRDDFFALGGDSLLAVRLFAQVSKLTGKNLPLVTLFQAPTIEQLAAILRQEGWEAPWASLVPIKPGGSKPPFYCVHGVGGNILEYLDLAKYMDEDQPFYGLQAIGLDGKRPMQDLTVEQMAAHYIREIRAFQSHGPYYLGGSSFGGLVAYEMAQQLRAADEQVALLAFFDTNGPCYPRYLPTTRAWRRKLNWWCDRVALHWGNFLACSGRERFQYVAEKGKRWKRQTRWKIQRVKARARERMQRIFWTEAIRQVHVTGYRAATAYHAKPYHGLATLFRATEQPRGVYEDAYLGWGSLVSGGLEIYDTPGHHGAIVREPRARLLAAQLANALGKAQGRAKALANSDGNESMPSVQNRSNKSSTTLAAAKMAAMLSVVQSSIT